MGNRAVITTEGGGLGIYLHWNGGLTSVVAFLDSAKKLGIRNPQDSGYFFARMCQLIGNFFGGNSSVGIARLEDLDCDNGDNGMYVIDDDMEIINIEHSSMSEGMSLLGAIKKSRDSTKYSDMCKVIERPMRIIEELNR